MAEVRIFSGAEVVADYVITHPGWQGKDVHAEPAEADYVAEAKRMVVEDGHLTAEEAEAASYMVSPE